MLRDILHLNVVTGFTTDGFEQFVKLTDKVAVAWREIETPDNENWATELGRKAGCSISTAHSRRDDWLAKHKIDISLPYALYRDILFFGANSFTRPADRTATIQAVWRGDGKKLMDLRAQSAREFDLKRVNVVGAMVNGRPKLIALKSFQDALPAPSHRVSSPLTEIEFSDSTLHRELPPMFDELDLEDDILDAPAKALPA